ncbi:hypothetical protein PoB_006715900 [Plakobranchus ocellatus]|uniref:Serpin domain-containing protein n=1 Tax=Plakobranchus ocellatus TaxID=259542 RepID=A0AAV4D8Z7_9GAST|nr:hypothetical protein PoB_006715900 [Plakobranchus ocellatus]
MGPNLSLTAAFVGVMALTHLCETMSLQELHVGDKDTAASSVSKPMVALKSIERKVAANGRNNFTARFVKNIQNLKILVNTVGFLPADPDSLFEEPGGVWVTSFVAQALNTSLSLMFLDKDVLTKEAAAFTGQSMYTYPGPGEEKAETASSGLLPWEPDRTLTTKD